METLGLLGLWKPITDTQKQNQPASASSDPPGFPDPVAESDDEDDSFFDLELPLPDFNKEKDCNANNGKYPEDNTQDGSKMFDKTKDQNLNVGKKVGNSEPKYAETAFPVSSNDHFSKRKIIPVEFSLKPQSPMALLKSAPGFRVFTFRKSKVIATQKTGKAQKGDKRELNMEKQIHERKRNKHFTVKFELQEVESLSMLTRGNSLRKSGSISRKQSMDSVSDDSLKRFSKDLVQKYLKLIKSFHVKGSKRQSEKEVVFSGDLSMASPALSPAAAPAYSSLRQKHGSLPAGIRVVCKQLGKSRSASSAVGVASPISRRDDSLLLQHDGIQSAILHCKRSFNASSDFSMLSRSTSNSSIAKWSTSSSEDSYVLSRVRSDSSFDKAIPHEIVNRCGS